MGAEGIYLSWRRRPRSSGRSSSGATTTWRSPPGRSPRGSSSTLGGRDGRGPRADRARAQGRAGRHRARASRSASTARSSGSPRSRSPPGSWVHVHNVKADLFERDYAFATERPRRRRRDRAPDLPRLPPPRRPGRHAELRRRHQHGELLGEHLAVHRRPVPGRRLAEATSPTSTASSRSPTRGAAASRSTGRTTRPLERVLAGFANHPNVAAYVLVGLGLRGQLRRSTSSTRRTSSCSAASGERQRRRTSRSGRRMLNIQEQGGIAKTVEAAVAAVNQLLPEANAWTRTEQPASKIHLAMECGGSDGNSGVTANPALGVAADLVVAQGGTAVLGETTEIYGAEHLLTRRAVSPRGRREAGRADQVVGVVRRRLRRRDQQQPVARQQERRPDDDLREVARGAGQGGDDAAGRRRRLRRAGRHAGPGLHGHARLTTPPAPPAWSPAGRTSWSSPPAAAACSA